MSMLTHTVKMFDSDQTMPMSMVAHTVGNVAASPTLEGWKQDAFSAMNKNTACHNTVSAPGGKKNTYKIVMIRHGESDWNKENRFCGWFDSGLSEKGMHLFSFGLVVI